MLAIDAFPQGRFSSWPNQDRRGTSSLIGPGLFSVAAQAMSKNLWGKNEKTILGALGAILLTACSGDDCTGPQCKVLHFEPLYTTAPAAVTVTAGDSANFAIGGGTSPYVATSSDPNILLSLVSGKQLSIAGVSDGQGTVAVVDTAGKTITLDVTVANKGPSTAPPTIYPASITIGDCTTNVPFAFTGGTGPFSVDTSDNFNAPVSAAQSLGADHFFTASVKVLPAPYNNITLTVLDGQSRTATATILSGSAHPKACPTNPLLQTFPATANLRVNEKLSFQIGGGACRRFQSPRRISRRCVAKARRLKLLQRYPSNRR